METPTTRYARSDQFSIAYQVVGDGDLDLVYMPGFASHLEVFWEDPGYTRFLRRLASFSRLIMIDRLGTGLSDRLPEEDTATLEQRTGDIRAVLDAVGTERAVLLGCSEGSMPCVTFAATHPERTTALVTCGGFPRILGADRYPWGPTEQEYWEWVGRLAPSWGQASDALKYWAPSIADDQQAREWFGRYLRMAVSPGAAIALWTALKATDVTGVLPSIRVPTLIIHRTDDTLVPVEWSRHMAALIPGSKLVELPGRDHLWFVGDQDAILEEVQEFLTGTRPATEPDRVLATVMFTDIVGSTERAAELGDRRWRELLDSHEAAVRRELARHRGREVKTTGDGFLAVFDGPARGIRCASAVAAAVRPLGLEIRAGLHTGECEVRNGDVGGIAVHIGARVSAQAGPGEVLVSSTVRDLVAGSGIEFEDRGSHELKGVPGEWRLYAVRD